MIWGITDGSAGMQSQVEGVLQALGAPYVLKTCQRRRPYRWLPLRWFAAAPRQLSAWSDALAAPWPALVISSGRRSAPLALAVKAASGGITRAVHLTDPRSCRARFDLIVAMEHDATPGPNVIQTHFALHRITRPLLAREAARWEPHFAPLPGPWVAVLVGGSTHKYTLTRQGMQHIIAQLRGVLALQEGSLLMTVSRRTGAENTALLQAAFAGNPRVWMYDGVGENPYAAMLALANHIIVTDDSVNMLSEAYSTGTPLHILSMPGHARTKPARFAGRMIAEGIARPLALPLAAWRYPVVDEMHRVVEAVRRVLD